MEMTIKQLANELGVCKQTVNNAILQLNLQDTLHKVGNINIFFPKRKFYKSNRK